MRNRIFVLFVICSCLSCSRHSALVFEPLTDRFDIAEAEDKVFVLDSETTQTTDCLQFMDSLLMFTNKYDNSLVFYDFSSGAFKRKLKLEKEGGDGVGTSIFSYYRNQDSIYVWNYQMNTLFLLDGNAKTRWKKVIPSRLSMEKDSMLLWPIIMPRTNNPMVQIGEKLLLSGSCFGEMEGENSSNRPVLIWYDLMRDSVSYSDSYPSIYHKGNWGGGFTYRFPYYTVNSSDDVVLSFAADPDLRVRKATGDYETHYAGIGGNEPPIPPVEEQIGQYDERKIISHFVRNLSYSSIHYDKWKKLYYRLVLLPDNRDIDFKERTIRKPLALVVLDEDFRIICRKRLPQYEYFINECFVSPEGFHIQVMSDNDDIFRFKTFKVEQK